MNKVEVNWKGKMAFEAEVNDFKIKMDADESFGGENNGPRPKPLILASLGGCTSMDVISILKKMNVEPESYAVSIEGHLTEEHPKYYDKIHLTYKFKGKDLDYKKIEKAIQLSQNHYCGVSRLLQEGAEITYSIEVNE